MLLTALTREVSASIARCELTHLARAPIDLDLARVQHAAYERALVTAGCVVQRLSAGPEMPDSVFIEDTAVVLDELAIMTRPGAESRRLEVPVVERALAAYRRIARIEPPGLLDGGDVLTIGRSMLVGVSSRTNTIAIEQLRRLVAPFGYSVRPVAVTGCLHLKSAVTAADANRLLANPDWIPLDELSDFEVVRVHPDEPHAANVVAVGDYAVYPTAFPRTRDRLEALGIRVLSVDVGELAKAEGAVTCCSLIL